jgi:hypothetical protein
MDEETALRQKRACDERKREQSERKEKECNLDKKGGGADNDEEHKHRHGAPSAARLGIGAAVEAIFEERNKPAYPRNGMADRARKAAGIADQELDQQSQKRERCGHGLSTDLVPLADHDKAPSHGARPA